ncbi:hypothetical protein [Streptomyces scopuliridis]
MFRRRLLTIMAVVIALVGSTTAASASPASPKWRPTANPEGRGSV